MIPLPLYWIGSSLLISTALFLFIFQKAANIRKLNTVVLEVQGYTIEVDTRIKAVPLLTPRLFEEIKILDDENYYVLREKHNLIENKDEL